MKILVDIGYGKLILPADENIGHAMASLAKAEKATETGPWEKRVYQVYGRPEIKIIEDDMIVREGEENSLRKLILQLDKEKDALKTKLDVLESKVKKAGLSFEDETVQK